MGGAASTATVSAGEAAEMTAAPAGKLLGCEKVWTRPHRNRFHEVAL